MSVIVEFATDIIKQTAGILLALSPLLSPHIRDIVAKKIQLSFDKALEDKKSSNQRKNYISQARFDVEFETYRKLSKAYFNMVKCISELIPNFSTRPIDKQKKKEYEDKLYKDSLNAVIEAQDILHENAPFISKDLFNEYREILILCNTQIDVFSLRYNAFYLASSEEKENFSIEDYKRTREIKDKFDILNENVREYLASLDVL